MRFEFISNVIYLCFILIGTLADKCHCTETTSYGINITWPMRIQNHAYYADVSKKVLLYL